MAFSGGPDSTALLAALDRLRPSFGYGLSAAHLDHGLDAGSHNRARAARSLADRLGVPLHVARLNRRPPPAGGHGVEAWARERRRRFLRRHARSTGAHFVATGHHADDQAETILLRLIYGSGLRGLGGMRPRDRTWIRPLLDARRREIDDYLEGLGLRPVLDPTNQDPSFARNRIRRHLLPELVNEWPGAVPGLCSLARTTRMTFRRLDARLTRQLQLSRLAEGATLSLDALAELPHPLWPAALGLLHRSAGAPYPAAASAHDELRRQVLAGGRIGCDCGAGWRWESDRRQLGLRRRQPRVADFTYTFKAPGRFSIPELSMVLRFERTQAASWMFRGQANRAGLTWNGSDPLRIVVRNRRPGDRIRPLGSPHSKRLKDLLIDRRVPRDRRRQIPLLVLDDLIAWVPGITIDDRFRLTGEGRVWIAEVLPHSPTTPQPENPSAASPPTLEKGNEP